LIVAGPVVDPAPADPAVAQDIRPVPRMVLVVRGGRCIPLGLAPVALQAPVDGPPLALRGPVLVPAPVSVRLAPVLVVRVV
jgi:hypothetical protein